MMNTIFANVCALMYIYMFVLFFLIVCVTWFLKESFLTGSSAARLMLLSRMKKRMRFVKMLWLTILWHRTLNLKRAKWEKDISVSCYKNNKTFWGIITYWDGNKEDGKILRETDWGCRKQKRGGRKGKVSRTTVLSYWLVWLKTKNARASGMGIAFSFSWMSERGRGLGPTGISGSSSSSSPDKREETKNCEKMVRRKTERIRLLGLIVLKLNLRHFKIFKDLQTTCSDLTDIYLNVCLLSAWVP